MFHPQLVYLLSTFSRLHRSSIIPTRILSSETYLELCHVKSPSVRWTDLGTNWRQHLESGDCEIGGARQTISRHCAVAVTLSSLYPFTYTQWLPGLFALVSKRSRHTTIQSLTDLLLGLLPGDGIGREVIPAGRKILEALPKSLGLDFSFVHLDAGFDEFKKNGVALPEKTVETLKKECDGALFGAVR